MCGVVSNVSVKDAGKLIPPLKRDPTRTTPLQRKYLKAIVKMFNGVAKAARELIVRENAFDLAPRQDLASIPPGLQIVGNTRFAFDTDPQKVAAFQQWLQDQIDQGLLSVDVEGFVSSAYKKAAIQAYVAARPILDAASDFFEGTQAEFLFAAFDSSIVKDRIELLATRAFEDLKGITSSMSADLNRIFADGIAHGRGPHEIARTIDRSVDKINRTRAVRLARTEIVHTYAEGSLDSYERLGVEEVGILAEWSTAGDDRVCPQCQPLEGVVMTVKEARGLIPLHPNCRCAWIPYLDDLRRKGKGKTNPAPKKLAKAKKKAKEAGAVF